LAYHLAMPQLSNRLLTAAGIAIGAAAVLSGRAAAIACDADNGGITLPAGFCAVVVADDLGPARHLVVAPNGDVFVSLENSRGQKGGIVALRDTTGDGRADVKERFGDEGATGVALRNGYLYYATTRSVERFKMTAGELKPGAPGEKVVVDLPVQREHADKTFAFDGKGSMYVNVGAPSNTCQAEDRKPKSPGQDPCPLLDLHGGIWKFSETAIGQTQARGSRYATGMRQMVALDWHAGSLFVAMNGRDQLDTIAPDRFTARDNAERPAEELLQVAEGANFGWPFCFFDLPQGKLLLSPEYGGDGKTVGRCDRFAPPVVAFPAHWAPVDLMFYTGTQFPKAYQGGAFIAFHGSWNRSPMPQEGYNVTFVPFSAAKPSGKYEVFANGFAGKTPLMRPNEARYRADGVAQGPDGSLYIAESQKGRVWRVFYRGA
jgi:glucose/arabinose dehydrogenase